MDAVRNHLRRAGGGLFVLMAFLALPGRAATYTWADSAGGPFPAADNWTPAGGPPGSADTAIFNLNATYQVDFAANATTADAQFTAGGAGATVTLAPATGVTWASNRILAGYGVTANALAITGGTVTAAYHFALGAGNGSGNSVTVSGSGARLTTTNFDLGVGYYIDGGNYGNNNTLTASAGGVISAGRTLYLGSGTATGNLLEVTGAGSQVTAGTSIAVSGTGGNNRLTVADGATASAPTVSLGGDANSLTVTGATVTASSTVNTGGTNNTVTATDGATVTGSGEFIFASGAGASGNTLTVSGGATVTGGGHARLGYAGANGNTVTITGTGSLLKTNSYDLGVGNYNGQAANTADNTRVTVSSGGELRAARDLFIGAGASSGNQVTVTGSGSKATAVSTSITVGGTGGDNGLTVQGGATAGAPNLVLGGADNFMTVDGTTLAAGSTISVRGTNNTFTATNGATVTGELFFASGSGVSGNLLAIDGGSTLTASGHARLGYNEADGNTVLVTGAGSQLRTTSWDIGVGNEAGGGTTANNTTVTIADGGRISAGRTFFLGAGAATGHLVTVTGANSVLEARTTNGWEPSIVLGGTGNTLRIEDQGQATSTGYGLVGGTSNQAFVEGGSWTASAIRTGGTDTLLSVSQNGSLYGGDVRIGDGGSGSTLNLTAGTVTSNGHFYVGSGSGTGAKVNVAGPGALLKANLYDIHVGYDGVGNTMTVSGGGTATSPRLTYVGETASATGNRLIVTGPGSLYRNGGNQPWAEFIYVGNATAGDNTVEISDGAVLDSLGIVVGAAAGNAVTNVGGTYEFRHANPNLTPGAGGISLNGGTISYRGLIDADVKTNTSGTLQSITFAGDNTFMLNSSSSIGYNNQTYTYDSVANTGDPRNYQRLVMVNGTTGIPLGDVTIGTGGAMLADNTTATLGQTLTNQGELTVDADATLSVRAFSQTAGTSTIDGTLTATNPMAFTGGTLYGVGTLAGGTASITADATVAPGHSPGTLTFDNLTLADGGTYAFEYGDLIVVNNLLTLVDDWTLSLDGKLGDGGRLELFEFGVLAANPDLLPTFDLSQLEFTPSSPLALEVDGNSIYLLGIQVVPEPGGAALLLAALAAVCRRWPRPSRVGGPADGSPGRR
ncbi:MAG: hypothetical protein BWZ02_02278 [Lentisphaerae bacterium ADurb.BinA184]|nr:MAG: hypothetical protein BWZ02_02278 [Lentisphaerae bacterium ADurb.BinA184]